jgi:hypothetical protein
MVVQRGLLLSEKNLNYSSLKTEQYKISEPKRYEFGGKFGILHNDKFPYLYNSPSICYISEIKKSKMDTWRVTRTRDRKNVYRIQCVVLTEMDHLEYREADGRLTISLI